MNLSKLLATLFLSSIFVFSVQASEEVKSPNGRYFIDVNIESGRPYLVIKNKSIKGELPLQKIRLGLTFQNAQSDEWKLTDRSGVAKHKDDYQMITGKRSHCINEANVRSYTFQSDKNIMNVEVRAYNDGVAFRYVDKDSTPKITGENTAFLIKEGMTRWQQIYDGFGYENFYEKCTDGKALKNRNRIANQWGYPMLLKSDSGIYTLITESNIRRGDCASLLNNKEALDEYKVERGDVRYNKLMPASSPWRVLIIGSLSDIVESTLVTDLAEPSQAKDTDWIKPGAASWVYWAYNHGSKDFKIVKEFIDLAARMKWPYVLIDWEWDVMQNGGDVEKAVKYAQSLGVKPMLWYNSLTSWKGQGAPGTNRDISDKAYREKEFAWLSSLGVAGVKIDFFKEDGSDIMNYYQDLMECAARNHLLINFHGATVPRGWNRTYPNLMSAEAVYGAEYYNNDTILTRRAAWHNSVLPFTRNVVGSMDYTPGTFTDTQHPHSTSDGHELALSFLFESALQHMPDRPSAYASLPQEVQALLSETPTAWDDTKLLGGEPGESVVMARRKGDTWYIAGINGKDTPQKIAIDLTPLKLKRGDISIYKDKDSEKGLEIIKIAKLHKQYSVNCIGRGGFVMKISD